MKTDIKSNEPLSFFELIEQLGDKQHIQIPDYQREYSYGRKSAELTMTRFADDLYKALTCDSPEASIELNPIYGDKADDCFIPVDGQQRLTTLYLLHWYLLKRSETREKTSDAEKEEIQKGIEKLKKFKYQTRTTVRFFCEQIIDWRMEDNTVNDGTISSLLRNQHWFTEGMDYDPTVNSMLTVMDYFHALMKNNSDADIKGFVDKLLGKSSCPVLLFNHDINLVPDDGDAEHKRQAVLDLYVKMNSRGTGLTGFEIIKAGFERQCEENVFDIIREYLSDHAIKDTPEERARLSGKINTKYTNFFFDIIDRFGEDRKNKPVNLAELRHDATMERLLVEIFELVFFCRMKEEGVDDKLYRGDHAYLRGLQGKEFLSFIQFAKDPDDVKGPLADRLKKYAGTGSKTIAAEEQQAIEAEYEKKAEAEYQAWLTSADGKEARKKKAKKKSFRNEYLEEEGKEKYDARLNKLFEVSKSAFKYAIEMYFTVQEELIRLQSDFSDGYLFGNDKAEPRYKELSLIRELANDEDNDRPVRTAVARVALFGFITRFFIGHEEDDDLKQAYKTWAGICSSICKSADINDFEGWITMLADFESILDELERSASTGITAGHVLTAVKEFAEKYCMEKMEDKKFKAEKEKLKEAGSGEQTEEEWAKLIATTKRKNPLIEEAVKANLRLTTDGDEWYEAMCELQNKLDGQIWLALELAKKEDTSGVDSFIGNHNMNLGSNVFPIMELDKFKEASILFEVLFDKNGVKDRWFIPLEKAILCRERSSAKHFYRVKEARDDFRRIPDNKSWRTALLFENGLSGERAVFYHFMRTMLDDLQGKDIDDSTVAAQLEIYGTGKCGGWREAFVEHPVLFEMNRGIEDAAGKNIFHGLTIGIDNLSGNKTRYTAVYDTKERKRKSAELNSFALALEISSELEKLGKTGNISYKVMETDTYLDGDMPNRYIEVNTSKGKTYRVGFKKGSKRDGTVDGFLKWSDSVSPVSLGNFDLAKQEILKDL